MNRIYSAGALIIALAALTCPIPALAQFVTLHNLGDGSVPNDGAFPASGFATGYDGTLYATAVNGGSMNAGCVYHMTREGKVEILHSFLDGSVPHDGYGPGALVFNHKDGYFYGLTSYGGTTSTITAGYGTLYKMSSKGVVTILHNFGDGSTNDDGINPSSLTLSNGGNFLYGTAPSDVRGTSRNAGAVNGLVFQSDLKGKVTIIRHFGDYGNDLDGAHPTDVIEGPDGNLYGTTLFGGSADPHQNGYGTIFRLTTAGGLKYLHSFEDGTTLNDGYNPQSGLVLGSNGLFYGTTEFGGAGGYGTVYSMTKDGVVTTLHSFGDGTTPDDGLQPFGKPAISWSGSLYGTTSSGGDAGVGTVYKIGPGNKATTLHSFGDTSTDGVNPYAGLTFVFDGYFYGTTSGGGTANVGTVFKFPYAYLPPPAPVNAN